MRDGHILLFRHPEAGVQLPKGTIENGEAPDVAVLRELAEESGICSTATPQLVSTVAFIRKPSGEQSDEPLEHQTWHLYLIEGAASLPTAWDHVAVGSAVEDGLTFSYFWHPLSVSFESAFPLADPVFANVTDRVAHFIEQQ